MKTKIIFISMMLLGIVLTSCYKPQEEATLDDYDLTLTYYNTEFSFDSYNTFMVRDSVLLLSDYLTDKQINEFYTDGTSDDIRAKISSELKALGYTEVEESENPDFLLNPTVTLMQNTSYYYYPGWWWGYSGYWGWYWKNSQYYYYPGYPSYGYSYSYTYEMGTLIMEMLDGKSIREYQDWWENNPNGAPEEAPGVNLYWTGHVEGVAGNTASYNKSRAGKGIEEAFIQSPYLKK